MCSVKTFHDTTPRLGAEFHAIFFARPTTCAGTRRISAGCRARRYGEATERKADGRQGDEPDRPQGEG
ncbi:hypothetical protein Ga0080559_TMP705 [Salipiger profundus]|uniref:Uncharacterized protein n=1 Tax=Salipiger profundus TaxID=1229727 RepID=A0A1U7D033_9RHOB|nr:hypothetical protein Ga0080559_TMP705 [Salipiger profundus]